MAHERPSRSGDGRAQIPVGREPEAASERAVKGVPEREPSADEPEAASAEPAGTGGEPVDSIKGIGAAYAQRLEAAGVHSVSDLAAADADDLASETDIGAGRLGNWIERARAQTK
ncbi:MAG TPA: DUF4332 domain-containing protein [Halobacteriales archaeon]|nr:DUF4332 domain-containing protein [Halobacteriales archaeon]